MRAIEDCSLKGSQGQTARQPSEKFAELLAWKRWARGEMGFAALLSALLRERIVRFVFVGVFGALVELGLFSVLLGAGMGIVLANVVAFHVAFAICFALHFSYTHRYSLSERRFFVRGFIRYAVLMYGQLSFGTFLLWVLIDKLGCTAEVAKLLQIGIVTPLGYLIQKSLIFRKSGP